MRLDTTLSSVWIIASVFKSVSASSGQQPFDVTDVTLDQANDGSALKSKPRPLTGRFLHITDFHPDPYYLTGASFETGCHRKPGKKVKGKIEADEDVLAELEHGGVGFGKDGKKVAGKWGTAVSDCDAPMSLVNLTFDWLQKEWSNEVDFVVWTGDNARHDIDRELPRTPKEIYQLNRMMADKMTETFGKHVIFIPSIGNNDIWPHNILEAGPSSITNEFTDIWSDFIPADDYHVFQRGAYFSTEVISDRLAVISLNTLYWYDANKAVDGCKDGSDEPGALEFDWLEVQLESFRDRGMQVWLTGHVPPHMGHYFQNCYLRYGELSLRYQDTIVGHLYGHMNLDHFFFIGVDELESEPADFKANKLNAASLPDELRKDFNGMPQNNKLKLEDYVVVNVAPSVVPTYLPGIRLFSYNISGWDHPLAKREEMEWVSFVDDLEDSNDSLEDGDLLKKKKKKKKKKGRKKPKSDCRKPEHEDQPHCKWKRKERYYSENSPSRSNRLFSPLGYAQFYLPDVDNQHEVPQWKLEYTTYTKDGLLSNRTDGSRMPVPLHLIGVRKDAEGFRDSINEITPFKLPDLTIPSWVSFAKRLANEKTLWKRFKDVIYVSSGYDDDK